MKPDIWGPHSRPSHGVWPEELPCRPCPRFSISANQDPKCWLVNYPMRSSPPISGRYSVSERTPTTKMPSVFCAGTHPTENLKLLIKDVAERLAGVQGGTPIFRLEIGFGGGKSHALIAAVHVAREGERLSEQLSDYGINRFPRHDVARVAAFVAEESDPLRGQEHEVDGQRIRTYTPWGQIALLASGLAGYD